MSFSMTEVVALIKNLRLFTGIILLATLQVACSLPAPEARTPSTDEVAAAYTAAAQTIVARLTQVAGTQNPALTPVAPEASAPPFATLPGGSPTPTATPTPTTQPTGSPTPTEAADDPALQLGSPDFEDTFNDSAKWAPYSDDHVSFEIGDDQLEMTAFEPEGWDGWMLTSPVVQDFYLEMEAEPGDCSGLDRYGLVARANNTKKGYANYLFGFSCDGRYSLRYWDGEHFDTLIDWTASDAITKGPGESNRLGFYADGEHLALYANGQLLEEITDDSSLEGKFGVFVGSDATEDLSVQVDRIAAWDLP